MNPDNTAQLRENIITQCQYIARTGYTDPFYVDQIVQSVADYISQLELPEKRATDIEQGVSRYHANGKDMWGNHYADITNSKIVGYNQALTDTTALLAKAVRELRK